MTDSAAEQRVRAYLAAFPDTINLGPEIAYGSEFNTPDWPYAFYPLTRADIDAVLGRLDRLTTELRQHETCRACGHERHEHAHDTALHADYCSRCTIDRDVHDFQPEEQQ